MSIKNEAVSVSSFQNSFQIPENCTTDKKNNGNVKTLKSIEIEAESIIMVLRPNWKVTALGEYLSYQERQNLKKSK